jgi:hypothetical protein
MKDKKDEAGQAVIQLPRIQKHETQIRAIPSAA